jgi:hypothetical protein
MNFKAYYNFLLKPILSLNGVLEFTFTLLNAESGEVVAYDNLLEVRINAKWKFIETTYQKTLITIDGFDIVKFGESGLICEPKDLEKELIYLESAYDLCYGK